jgi:hypothetical protein
LKAFQHIVASSAETIGAFNAGFETVNLHRPAGVQGLTLVHFSAQPEPFLTQNTP